MLTSLNKRATLVRDCVATQVPSGMPVSLPAGSELHILQNLGGTFTVRTPFGEMARISEENADALGLAEEERGPRRERAAIFSEEAVWAELATCYDPEIPVNIVELGLIYGVEIGDLEGGRHVKVRLTLTAPGCGMGDVLKTDIEQKLARLPSVTAAEVEVVLDPPWNPSMMSETARLELGFM